MGLVVLMERPGYRLTSDSPVVKRDEVNLVTGAESIWASTERAVEATMQTVQRLQDRAAETGYLQGHRAGEESLAAALAKLAVQKQGLVASLEPILVEVVMEAVGTIVRKLGREHLFGEALSALGDVLKQARWAVLRVAPDQVDAAQAALASFVTESGLGAVAQVVADDGLAPEDCVFQTDLGEANAGLAVQLEALHAAIRMSAGAWLASRVPPASTGGAA